MKKVGNEKYCLNNKINVLWVDKTFSLAKVLFINEGKERIIGVGLITDEPLEQYTINLSLLTGGIR